MEQPHLLAGSLALRNQLKIVFQLVWDKLALLEVLVALSSVQVPNLLVAVVLFLVKLLNLEELALFLAAKTRLVVLASGRHLLEQPLTMILMTFPLILPISRGLPNLRSLLNRKLRKRRCLLLNKWSRNSKKLAQKVS